MAITYQGFLQEITQGNQLLGWAWNPENSSEIIQVVVFIDGVQHAVIQANQVRNDLKKQGIVKGDHGYSIDLSTPLSDGRAHQVEARYLQNNVQLGRSPIITSARPVKSTVKHKPDLAVILGMHRSGTSLSTRVLTSGDISIGANLIQGQTDNPDGFFENAAIVACQKKMETCLNREHYNIKGTQPFPKGWLNHPEVVVQKKLLKQIITKELKQNTASLWAFKDPRSLRFIPLWKQIFQELNLQPAYILCVRHPHAVIQSLLARNKHPRGQTELLWLIHLLEGLEQIDILQASIIHYERWFNSPAKQFRTVTKALNLSQPNDKTLQANLRKIINKRKNHFDPSIGTRPLHSHTQALYDLLKEPMETPEDSLGLRLLLAKIRNDMTLFKPWLGSETEPGLKVQ